MPLTVACLSCGAKVRAPDKAAGRSLKCPKCGDVLRVPPQARPPQSLQRPAGPQMISVSCPHCTTKLSMEADSDGGMASCPMCGGTFSLSVGGGAPRPQMETVQVPYERSEEVKELHDPETEEQELQELKLEEQEPEEQEAFRYDDEPWYYGYLEKYAKSLNMQGYIIAGICAVLATGWFIMFLMGGISTLSMIGVSSTLAVLVCLLGWVLSLAVIAALLRLWLVGAAAILLVVDTARNLRALKKK